MQFFMCSNPTTCSIRCTSLVSMVITLQSYMYINHSMSQIYTFIFTISLLDAMLEMIPRVSIRQTDFKILEQSRNENR